MVKVIIERESTNMWRNHVSRKEYSFITSEEAHEFFWKKHKYFVCRMGCNFEEMDNYSTRFYNDDWNWNMWIV